MREVELTVEVKEELESVIAKLEDLGFSFVEEYVAKDYYMAHNTVDLNSDNYDILKKCLLLRTFIGDNVSKSITYKDKVYDDYGSILSQRKMKIKVESISLAKEMLEAVGFKVLFEVINSSVVYKKGDTSLAIQSIQDPKGLYIELEATEEELKEQDDNKVKELLKRKLDALNLNIGSDYEVKKAIIALNGIRN
jgi:predicted adenylyl cyclase CyaB